jgi:hypothetical protein
MERIDPMVIKFSDNEKYTLQFNRETASALEQDGFKREDIADMPMTRIPQIFYFAFKMHHPNITKEKTDEILFNDLGGLTEEQIEKLGVLFMAPYTTLINENGKPKNAKVTVNL